MKVKVINMDVDTRKYLYLALGISLIILGIILLFEYLFHFFRIFVGLIFIFTGIYFLFTEKTYYRFKRFRF